MLFSFLIYIISCVRFFFKLNEVDTNGDRQKKRMCFLRLYLSAEKTETEWIFLKRTKRFLTDAELVCLAWTKQGH